MESYCPGSATFALLDILMASVTLESPAAEGYLERKISPSEGGHALREGAAA